MKAPVLHRPRVDILVAAIACFVIAAAPCDAQTETPASGEPQLQPTDTPNHGIPVLPNGPVIPPGQEELLSKLVGLGEVFPGGCKFSGGNAENDTLTATYTCSDGTLGLRLQHPDYASQAVVTTQNFAITVSQGSPPPGMLDALSKRIREHESQFQWLVPQPPPLVDEVAVPYVTVAIGAVALLSLVAWLRSRRQRSDA